MIEIIVSIVIFIITIFFAGFQQGKKSIKIQLNKLTLDEIQTIHEDSIKRSNDDRVTRIERLSRYKKD